MNEPEMGRAGEDVVQVRRATRSDLSAVAALVQQATGIRDAVDEAVVLDWLLGKGLLLAVLGRSIVGVAAWQAENLVAVTDQFHVHPPNLRPGAGRSLLETIEAEANVLMCEANVVILPPGSPREARTFFESCGYAGKPFQALHRIWREVLSEFLAGEPELMVKQLREKMVMAPI